MLYTVKADILVNVDDQEWPEHQDAVVTDGLNEMFRQVQYEDDKAGQTSFIVDWGYEQHPTDPGERNIVARPDLDPATYEEGDAWLDPTAFNHIFLLPFGLPPGKDDKPLCGADLPDSWDFPESPRPPCPRCEYLVNHLKSK